MADAVGNRPVLYLEFGVNQGESISFWSTLLTHPDSRLHGFDSFEGLPETFDERQRLVKGAFAQGGKVPAISDSRVSFHKGWFSETLPAFVIPPHEQLVIVMDADLYSSTVFVLRHLDSWITPGTYIYFDDLVILGHETQAIDEYLSESGKCFEGVAVEWAKSRAVFRCVACSG